MMICSPVVASWAQTARALTARSKIHPPRWATSEVAGLVLEHRTRRPPPNRRRQSPLPRADAIAPAASGAPQQARALIGLPLARLRRWHKRDHVLLAPPIPHPRKR